jgi:murein peptide amidase A
MRRVLAPLALVAGLLVGPATAQPEQVAGVRVERIGRSVQGRPIVLARVGDPAAPRKVLVVGCIHGDEGAGRAVVNRLRDGAAPPPGVELLLVRDLNPDGRARRTRQNAHGVDLNRNSSHGWRNLGPPGSRYYAGPRPFSEPETRAIRALILRERPAVTIWYHQPFGVVDFPERGSARLTRAYSGASRLPAQRLGARPGSMSRWENARVRRGSSIVVELPAGPLPAGALRRHVAAVLAVAADPRVP